MILLSGLWNAFAESALYLTAHFCQTGSDAGLHLQIIRQFGVVEILRLPFIEFFGKFFTDGGRPFSPLVADCRYTRLSPAENTDC